MGYAPFHSAVRLSIPCFESLSRDYPLRTALWRASRLPTGLTLLCFYALLNRVAFNKSYANGIPGSYQSFL